MLHNGRAKLVVLAEHKSYDGRICARVCVVMFDVQYLNTAGCKFLHLSDCARVRCYREQLYSA
jgi:hypothetical protein